MSLLHDIQNAATDKSVSVSTILRKAKILASRLKERNFDSWLEQELNGYPDDATVPSYRVARGVSHGLFALTFQRTATLEIPASVLPKEYRHWGESVSLRAPIATYSVFVEEPRSSGQITFPWPTELARKFGTEAFSDAQCLNAWLCVDRSTFVGLLDTVRNRLLSFALAVESENPQAGEASIGSTPVEPGKVSQFFQTIIYGGSNNLANASHNFIQNSSVPPGNFQILRGFLQSSGANSDEITELETELQRAKTPNEKQQVADTWLGRTTRNAIAAARTFVVEISAKAIAEFLRPPGP